MTVSGATHVGGLSCLRPDAGLVSFSVCCCCYFCRELMLVWFVTLLQRAVILFKKLPFLVSCSNGLINVLIGYSGVFWLQEGKVTHARELKTHHDVDYVFYFYLYLYIYKLDFTERLGKFEEKYRGDRTPPQL